MSSEFEDLFRQTDEAWYWYLMSKDPLYSKLDFSLIPALITQAEECGISVASQLIQEWGTRDILEIYKLLGVEIRESDDGDRLGFYYLSVFEPDNLVRVFVNRLEEVEAIMLSELGGKFLIPGRVKTLLLAHELYHFLENRTPTIFTESYRFKLWNIGPFAYKSQLIALSEIGATAFAKAICMIDYNPCIINYALLFSIAPQSASQLYQKVVGNSSTHEKRLEKE